MMSLFSWLRPPPPVNPPGISISSRRKSGLEAVTLPAQSQTPRCALTQARLCLHYQSQLSSGSSLPHGPTATDPGSHTCILRSSYRIHRLLVTYRTTRRPPHISRVKNSCFTSRENASWLAWFFFDPLLPCDCSRRIRSLPLLIVAYWFLLE